MTLSSNQTANVRSAQNGSDLGYRNQIYDFIPPAFIDSLARLGVGKVNVASLKAASLLSSGLLFSRKFNLVSIMNQSKGKALKNYVKASCRTHILTLDQQSILELGDFPIKSNISSAR